MPAALMVTTTAAVIAAAITAVIPAATIMPAMAISAGTVPHAPAKAEREQESNKDFHHG